MRSPFPSSIRTHLHKFAALHEPKLIHGLHHRPQSSVDNLLLCVCYAFEATPILALRLRKLMWLWAGSGRRTGAVLEVLEVPGGTARLTSSLECPALLTPSLAFLIR